MMLLAALLVLGPQDTPSQAESSVRKLRVAPGLKVELFAAEPQAVNIVSFAIDDRMRFYVAETHRRRTSVYEVWDLPAWQDGDLAARTVEDRVALYRKMLGPAAPRLEVESERIRLLEDRRGKGRADVAVTFAEGFRSLADGLGSSVVARGDDVWFTCAPNLWRFRGTTREVLHTGFGVHVGSGAHDLHGLCFGPDGKLYFSMGDRGLRVGAISLPDTGSVLRCNPDGSELEVFATGLRNPEQLVFDDRGNLWTGDNNSDVGDAARWLWVVEGGDYGWSFGFQHQCPKTPWMTEKWWGLDAGRDVAHVVPPVGHAGRGPSGVAFYGGTGLPGAYDGRFFLCDFPGGVRSLAVRPKGAGFELVEDREFLWELWPTDVKVGPDGAVYVSDWVEGWEKPGKGRIYKVFDPALANDVAVVETKRLLAEGLAGKTPERLAELLGHANQRVRMAAQAELVVRGEAAALERTAARGPDLGRLHAIWGLGQLKRPEPLLPLLSDSDAEVRAQAAKVLGELREARAFDALVAAPRDPSPRVRLFAAMSLGKLKRREAVAPLLEMLRATDDPFLRHAGVAGLVGIGDVEALLKEDSLAALLALRRLGRPEVARFLDRPGMDIEAARAIYDVPIPAALPALASLISKPSCSPPVLSRALNANFRLGAAREVGAFAARESAPQDLRAEALRMLADWAHPSGRDRLLGAWRPIESRDPAPAREALAAIPSVPAALRIEFLRALAALGDPRARGAVATALESEDEALRLEAVRLAVRSDLPDKASLLARLSAERNPLAVRQQAIASMGDVPGTDPLLTGFLDQLLEGKLPAALHLDVLEAAGKRPSPELRTRLARVEALRKKDDALAPWREALEGGDATAGKAIFFERTDVACVRCHGVKGKGGTVGPALTKVGAEKTREYLLESLLFPNKQIAKGYGQEAFALADGDVIVARVERENDAEVLVVMPDGQKRALAKAGIRARKASLSAMPEDVAKPLSKRDLRDVVAFLSGLR